MRNSFYGLKLTISVLLCHFLLNTAGASELNDFLKTPESISELNRITRSELTYNYVTLLPLGQSSVPARLQLIENAKRYIFVSTGYWGADEMGMQMAAAMLMKSQQTPGLDFFAMEDWVSPFYLKHGHDVKKVLGEHLQYWNAPTWQRNFSLGVMKNHLHDKMMIVDDKAIVGTMNLTNDHLLGGSRREGWADIDMLVQGPAAYDLAKKFYKIWTLSNYLKGSGNFPPWAKLERAAFENYFYKDIEDHDFFTVGDGAERVNNPVHISFHPYLNDPKKFPPLENSPLHTVPLRMIYDNALIDRKVQTGKHFSKTFDTIQYLLKHSKSSATFFFPYLTLTEEMMNELTSAAARGLRVTVVTNSMQTNDVGAKAQREAATHYERLISSGVRVYEWQGHKAYYDIETANNCKMKDGNWPGQTLHTKLAFFDDSVFLLGSNNMNQLSLNKNAELMTLVNDSSLAQKISGIVEQAISPQPETIGCGDKLYPRPPRTEAITPERLDSLKTEYQIEAETFKYGLGH